MRLELPDYYSWNRVPPIQKTKKQWLKLHRRLVKNAQAVGRITLVFDKPRSRPKGVDPVPREECEQIRQRLERLGTDGCDLGDLDRLDRAGQLAIVNLYPGTDTEAITSFREPEATKLLGYMIWDHCHEDHFLTEAT